MFSLMRNIGSTIGISVVVSLLAQNTQINHATLAAHATPFNPMFQVARIAAPGASAARPARRSTPRSPARPRPSPISTTSG